MPNKADATGKDRFGDLTDDLLRHVLSFLPLKDALETCVLDTRWRDHWRRSTSLDFSVGGWGSFPSFERLTQLLKLFIHLRGDSPLDKCKIDACLDDENESIYTHTVLLIEYALKCQVKELIFSATDFRYDTRALDGPLISQHLKTIQLERVNVEGPALNFSRCPLLEDLEMEDCIISVRKISSKSLKRLCITRVCSFPEDLHTRIFAPGLTDLQLDGFEGLPPFLEYMPFLVTGYVGLSDASHNFCHEDHECGCHSYPVEESVFLNGLSNAVNLELIAGPEMLIYRWDLEWCPIFDKLKTLLLNEWFRAIDLVCILQHSPILEVLTLQLGNTKNLIRATGAQETTEQSFVCAHLKVVNIECSKVDEGILTILEILRTCGVLRDRISIKALPSSSSCFSFQKGPTQSFHH